MGQSPPCFCNRISFELVTLIFLGVELVTLISLGVSIFNLIASPLYGLHLRGEAEAGRQSHFSERRHAIIIHLRNWRLPPRAFMRRVGVHSNESRNLKERFCKERATSFSTSRS